MQLCVVAYKITAYRDVSTHTDPRRTAPTNRVTTSARAVVPG